MIGAIETKQVLELKNVLHFRGKINQQQSLELSAKIEKILTDNNAKKRGPSVSATNAILFENGQQVMDIDMFIPVDKELEVAEGFDFISDFKVENALKVRVEGNPSQLNSAMESITTYIKENNLIPTTPVLVSTVKEATTPLEIEEMIMDIYLGIQR